MIDDKRDEDENADLEGEDEEGEEEDEEYEEEEEFDEDEEDEEDSSPRIEPERAKAYGRAITQLRTFHREISVISNKKPDSPLNKFKLALVNETLEKANFVLGDEFLPFPGFKTFDEANMPSASDVVLMVSHYMDGLRALRDKYCAKGEWNVTSGEKLGEDSDDVQSAWPEG